MEDLSTEDFVRSASGSAEVRISQSEVTFIQVNLHLGTAVISFAVGGPRTKVMRMQILFLELCDCFDYCKQMFIE